MIERILLGFRQVIAWFQKRRTLRAFRRQLAPALVARYGRAASYTPAQVTRTAEALGLSTVHLCFAYAMFSERRAFDTFHAERGEPCDYDAMRDVVQDHGSHLLWSGTDTHHHVDVSHHVDVGHGHHHGHDVLHVQHHHHHHHD